MCLYFRSIENPRYKKTGTTKAYLKYVTIKCGECIECRQARAREWQQRLDAELRFGDNKRPFFITLTVSDEVALKYGIDYENMSMQERVTKETYQRENDMIKDLVRKWRNRCEKNGLKKKQWLITEHGEDNSYRIHVHGVLWTDDIEAIQKAWSYGYMDVGGIRDSTIGYLVKYIHKAPEFHRHYKSIVLTSPGIGKAYCLRRQSKIRHEWRGRDTNYKYKLPNGVNLELCDYFKKKLFKMAELETRRKYIAEDGQRWVKGLSYNKHNDPTLSKMYQKLRYEQDQCKILDLPRPEYSLHLHQNDEGDETYRSEKVLSKETGRSRNRKNRSHPPNLENRERVRTD